jgi:hypothetical protein
MSAPTIPTTAGTAGWFSSIWQYVGNTNSWGLAYFVTSIATMLMPFSFWPAALTWSVKAIAYVITPLVANTALGPVLTFFTGNGFADIITVVAYFVSWVMNYAAFIWLTTGLFNFWVFCLAAKFVLVIKHEIPTMGGNAG